MGDRGSVSVVVPVYNQAAILPVTLPAVMALEEAREIIFVDDGSTDASARLIEGAISPHAQARLLRHPANRGRAAARNTGLEHASGEIILFLDADIIPEPNLIRAHADRYENPAVVGVLSRDEPDALDPADPFHRYLLGHAGPRNHPPDEPLHFKHFIIGYTSIRRQALDEIGGFDESIDYGEDLDLAFRLNRRWPDSLRIEPTAIVHQRNVGDLDERLDRLRNFGRNLPALLAKHPGLRAAADLSVVASLPARLLLRRPLERALRFFLRRSPRPTQIHLVRLLLAAAVTRGFRESNRPPR